MKKQVFFIKKRIEADNITEAIKKEKKAPIQDIWTEPDLSVGFK